MKKRYIVLAAVVLGTLLVGLCLGAARRGVVGDDRRDFAAEAFRGASDTRYVQLSLYCDRDDYLTPDGMMRVKNSLETSLVAESIAPAGGYLLCGSGEEKVSLTRGTSSAEAVATVYFGNWFGLHPTLPLTGGFVDDSATGVDYCVIDDYAAWRLFGSTDVCGLDIEIDGQIYTVTAVVEADKTDYADYYGITPRVYIRYNSAAMRQRNLSFTALECVLPSPISDFAAKTFKEAVSAYGEDIVENTGRYTPTRLWNNIRGMTEMAVADGDSFPYYENISRIRETKCAMILVFEGICYISSALTLAVLLYLVLHPLAVKHREKRAAKKRHAIV